MSRNLEFRISGLREDDADLRLLSGAYETAAGSAEGDRPIQPAELVSDGRIGGLREDDAEIRLRGLREDDAEIRLGGLREDDAEIRLGGAYAPSSYGSAAGDLEGLREDDAGIALYGLREDNADIRLGDVDSLSAEGARVEQLGERQLTFGLARKLRAIAARAGRAALRRARTGSIKSKDEAEKFVRAKLEDWLQATKAQVESAPKLIDETVAFEMERIDKELSKILERGTSVSGLRLGYILRGLREDDAELRLMGLREDDAEVSLHGLREDDAEVRLSGDKERALDVDVKGFHERFPVVVEIKGLGRIDAVAYRNRLTGLFDFLKPATSTEEYLAKLVQLRTAWAPVRADLMALPAQQRAAIEQQMVAMGAEVGHYDRAVDVYISEGAAGMTSTRVERVKRLEAALPTIRKLIDQAKAFGPAPTPAQEVQVARETAIKDLDARIASEETKDTFVSTVLPIAGGAALVGGTLLLVL